MPGLPKTRDGCAALVVAMALAGLGAWQATGGNWTATVIAVLGVLGTSLGVAVKLGPRGPAALLALMMLSSLAACGSPYATAKRSTFAVMQATQTAGDGLGGLAKVGHEKCLAKHGRLNEAYKSCVSPWLGRLSAWQTYGRPTARTKVAALYGAVRLADAAGGKGKKLDWMALFKAAGCVVVRSLKEWGHLLPDQAAGVLQLLTGVEPMACAPAPAKALTAKPGAGGLTKSAGVVPAVAAGLGIALEVLAWIRKTLADPADELFKAVDEWLKKTPKDTTDEALKLINDNLPRPPRDVPARP